MSEHDEPDEGEEDLFEEGPEAEADPAERRRRRLERILPQVLKRAIERGLEKGFETISDPGEALRGVVGENVKLPKEIVGYIFSQVEETKNGMVRVVAHEIRDFLEATDLSKELQKALTSLSFEIRTEIRFIPNEAGGVRPDVKASIPKVRGKRDKTSKKDEKRRGTVPPPSADEEPDDDEE
ncbi:MAG: hypothetical protein VYE22_29045 [Myxococcota bacterium]|nr:hypothetical protein [Myxococcota bacterium]